MTKRHVSLPAAAESAVDRFVEAVDDRLSGPEDTCEVVQETLVDLFGDREPYEAWRAGGDVTPAEKVRLQGYDPCNASLEAEYYAEKDEEQFTRSKHLQWLWRQFDATPMADNVEFALRFRQMLANHLFAEAGDGLRLFKGITFSYGHNIEMGDNVVVHDDVHLDDRGKLTVGDRVSISDDAPSTATFTTSPTRRRWITSTQSSGTTPGSPTTRLSVRESRSAGTPSSARNQAFRAMCQPTTSSSGRLRRR